MHFSKLFKTCLQLHMRKDGLVDDVNYESHDELDEIGLDEISVNQKAGSYNVTSQPSDRRSNISVKLYRSNEDQVDYRPPVIIATLPRDIHAATQQNQNSTVIQRSESFNPGYDFRLSHLDPGYAQPRAGYAHSEPGFSPRLNPGYSLQLDPNYLSLPRPQNQGYTNNTYQSYRLGYDSGTHSMRNSVLSVKTDQGVPVNRGYSDYHTGVARVVYPNSVPAYHSDSEPEYRGTMYITNDQQQTMF